MTQFWTVQKRSVLDTVIQEGAYLPSISASDYIRNIPMLSQTYSNIHKIFCDLNGYDPLAVSGMVFGFAKRVTFGDDDVQVVPYTDYEDFRQSIGFNREAVLSLWREFEKSDEEYVVLDLCYTEEFNWMALDINDFQAIMPPITLGPPFRGEASLERILLSLSSGVPTMSELPTTLYQVHAPYITRRNVRYVYPMFPLPDYEDYF